MKRKPAWWKLYVFAALACGALFIFPANNQAVLIFWVLLTYGGIALWLLNNQSGMDNKIHYRYTVVKPPVPEFYDEDRLYLQEAGHDIPDDDIENDPHGAASYHTDEM